MLRSQGHLSSHPSSMPMSLFHNPSTLCYVLSYDSYPSPIYPQLHPFSLSHTNFVESSVCAPNSINSNQSFTLLTLYFLAQSHSVCVLLCQVPALGVGLSTAAVWVKYKYSHTGLAGVYLQTTYTVHVCVGIYVYKRTIRILKRGQS